MAYVNLSKMPSAKREYVTSFDTLAGGLNLQELDYRIDNNESPEMKNLLWREGVLSCRDGQVWVNGTDGGTFYTAYERLWNGCMFAHSGDSIYAVDTDGTRTLLYTASDTMDVRGKFFPYNEKLYYKTEGHYVCIEYNNGAFSANDIIRSGLTEEEAKIAERKLIKRYDSRNREFGYNATSGGDISPMKSMQARAKSSASHKGKAMLPQTRAALLNSRLGISLSEDHKSKISSSISELWKDPEYRKRNVSKHLVRSVEQYSMDGSFVARYTSLKEADLSTGVDYRNIQACCKGRKRQAGGFIWKYSSSQANTEVNTETKESVSL